MHISFIKYLFIPGFLLLDNGIASSQEIKADHLRLVEQTEITTGAQQIQKYIPLLRGKSIGLVCNQTSLVGNVHLADTLLASGISIRAIFTPEHGFRGDTEAGMLIGDSVDSKTGIPLVSLYGNNKKPSAKSLSGIDIMVFDIQDVGARFYTYLSTLALVMESCAEQHIPVVVLDRPDPNGFYIDGPVLDTSCCRSFVGMYPVPVVYGMTIGEYARMVNGEGWLENSIQCDLTVVPLQKWERNMIVKLPVRPSPNLPDWKSVYLYPSLCLFEGTIMSVGRGTPVPFQVIGHPDFLIGSFAFTPEKIPGVAENPPYLGQLCTGQYLAGYADEYRHNEDHFNLSFLVNVYGQMKRDDLFFNNYFEKLAGTTLLREQIESGKSVDQIRQSWQDDIAAFLKTRKKYLLYPDFQ